MVLNAHHVCRVVVMYWRLVGLLEIRRLLPTPATPQPSNFSNIPKIFFHQKKTMLLQFDFLGGGELDGV